MQSDIVLPTVALFLLVVFDYYLRLSWQILTKIVSCTMCLKIHKLKTNQPILHFTKTITVCRPIKQNGYFCIFHELLTNISLDIYYSIVMNMGNSYNNTNRHNFYITLLMYNKKT
jgi:hypothetical protein